MLISGIEDKIKDSKFVNMIRMFLKAGYIEDFEYHGTISGTPQGGVISPMLANIYLHGLDRKVLELKEQFDIPQSRNRTPEYAYLRTKKDRLRKRIDSTVGAERDTLIGEYKLLTKELLKVPSKIEDDKKLVYCRYADDFLIQKKRSPGNAGLRFFSVILPAWPWCANCRV